MKAPEEFPLLFSQEQIQEMVRRVASDLERSIPENEEIVLIGVLKGAWVFHSDLARAVNRPVLVDFMRASSYGSSTVSSGEVKIVKDAEIDVGGRHVVLVEDIIDTGRTLLALKTHFQNRGAKTVTLAALLDKKCKREVECNADFVGVEIEDKFVVGYGLDWAEKYRALGTIHFVPPEIAASGKQP